MTQPTVTATLDKPAYAPGETMTLTVKYNDPARQAVTVTVTVTDAAGNSSAPVSVKAVIDPLTVTVTETGKTWVKQSDDGSVAVFTRTA